MKKLILGEAQDILKHLPIEQLNFFAEIRKDEKNWKIFNQYCFNQKQIKMDEIYRLRRPKNQDDIIKNAVEHEYYAARIASLVILLQIMENASDEIEKRERKEK